MRNPIFFAGFIQCTERFLIFVLKDAYLLEFVPMFSHSLKVQARNPKKVYVMDMGLSILINKNDLTNINEKGKKI